MNETILTSSPYEPSNPSTFPGVPSLDAHSYSAAPTDHCLMWNDKTEKWLGRLESNQQPCDSESPALPIAPLPNKLAPHTRIKLAFSP